MLGVYALSHAPGLYLLDTPVPASHLLLYLVAVVQLSDVLQYVFGKLLGRHRFSPNISPSKTIEGLIGGGLSAVVVGVALSGLTPFSLPAAAGISAAIVIAGFFGGFVLSAVKRDLGAKDWGTMIEGHGGVLDRLDSIIFAAPIFFHLVRYWYTP
jgi:phosphatidate cytidylyltransferase